MIQKCENIEVELPDESNDKLFTMYPELFFSVNTLNKIKIHKLIDKGILGKVNSFKIWNLKIKLIFKIEKGISCFIEKF